MELLDPLFGSEPVTTIFSAANTIQRMLDFEAALARAEARAAVIPASAVHPIVSACRVELFDLNAIAKAAADAGNTAIPLVKQLTALVAKTDKEAAGYVHWGATSQDVMDSGLVLQIRDALSHMESDLAALCDSLARLAGEHRSTPAVARTWLQQAIPTVLGLRFAGWLDALTRCRVRLAEMPRRVLVLQFGGAAGTLASLGPNGLRVADALAKELGLPAPALPWHTERDRFAEVATTLALLTGALGKIARDIALQAQTEVAEITEPVVEGRGGSSTMPQKQNPVASAVALAAATRVPGLVSTMLSAMVQEHERSLGAWHAEWETLPEIVRLSAGALRHLREIAPNLQISTVRLREHLEDTRGLIFAERISMTLAERIGKQRAHQLVAEASRNAVTEHKHLRDTLLADAHIREHLSASEIGELFAPESYLGMAQQFIDRAIAAHRP